MWGYACGLGIEHGVITQKVEEWGNENSGKEVNGKTAKKWGELILWDIAEGNPRKYEEEYMREYKLAQEHNNQIDKALEILRELVRAETGDYEVHAPVGTQGSKAFKKLFTCWKDGPTGARQEQMIKELKDENLRLKMQFKRGRLEVARKSVDALFGSHAEMLGKAMFTLWQETLFSDKHTQELEKVRTELAQLKLEKK